MASSHRVLDLSNGSTPKLSRAKRLIDVHCTHKWVIPGVSIERRTIAEMIHARAERAVKAEPLPYAEIFGLKFEHAGAALESKHVWDAQVFHLGVISQ